MIKWVDYYERNERSAKLYFDNLKLQKVSQNGTLMNKNFNAIL